MTAGDGGWAGAGTLLVDVLGTIINEAGSLAGQTAAALAAAGAAPDRAPAMAADWNRRTAALVSQVAAGKAPWRANDALRRAALLEAVQAAGLPGLPAAVLDDLALAGYRMTPWPDSGPALAALARSRVVIALSDATAGQLAAMSAAGGLAWHGMVCTDMTRAYQPDPAVYQAAIRTLGLRPGQVMMVAADAGGLRAAAGHGLRTAYVARPGQDGPEPGERFDVHARDLAELAVLLPG
jgi:2-haloacid dehalogenase